MGLRSSFAGGLLLLLFGAFFLLTAAGSDAFSSIVGRRSPELSSRNGQAAAGQQHSKGEQQFPADDDALASTRWPLSPRPVRVTLYGEARCPFCADWLVKNAQKLVDEVGSIIEFRAVEFGNARRNATTGELSCQHGPSECEANALFACTRELFDADHRWLNIAVCSERDVFEHAADPLGAFDACVVEEVRRGGGSPFEKEEKKGSFSSDDDDEKAGRAAAARLRACASGAEGAALIAEAEKETESLVPKHTFVPWVVVDGLPLGDASLESARSVACAAWRGKREKRPEACLAAPGLGEQLARSIF